MWWEREDMMMKSLVMEKIHGVIEGGCNMKS